MMMMSEHCINYLIQYFTKIVLLLFMRIIVKLADLCFNIILIYFLI